MKKKHVAGILALLLGIFGVHRYYLGQRLRGLMHFASFFIGLAFTVYLPFSDLPVLLFAIPAIVGLIDAILFFVMPKQEFNQKYNRGSYDWETDGTAYEINSSSLVDERKATISYKEKGIYQFRVHNYEAALAAFQKALDLNFDDAALHFNIACCYSILEDAESAFFHLDKARDFGFKHINKIETHDALAFVRSHDEYIDFVNNNYQMPSVDLNAEPTLDINATISEVSFNKIASLGELRDKGFLTEEEFSMQKQRILRPRE